MITIQSCEQIMEAAMLLLEQKGMRVEDEYLRAKLREYGGIARDEIVFFDRALSESALADSRRGRDEAPAEPRITACAEMYEGRYLSLEGTYEPVTLERMREYRKLSAHLPGIDGMSMLGCPAADTNRALQPLTEKLYGWLYGIETGQSIWSNGLLNELCEMWQIHADALGKPARDIFNGTVYMTSPLKLGYVEAAQVAFFHRKNLRVRVGTMASSGMSAPVTHAGAMALQLAERLFSAHLSRALWGEGRLGGGNNTAVMDLRSLSFRYGRPETLALNRLGNAVADAYGLAKDFHSGLTAAHAPGFEAGVEKAASCLQSMLDCGRANIAAGLLGVDEVFSPLQMALDGELRRYLQHAFERQPEGEDALALEALMDVPHGGIFADQMHTLEHFRRAQWQPALFANDMFAGFARGGFKTELDRAKERCLSILRDQPDLPPGISDGEERALRQVIARAERSPSGA